MELSLRYATIVTWPVCRAPIILLVTVSNAAQINTGCAHHSDMLRCLHPLVTLLWIAEVHSLPNVTMNHLVLARVVPSSGSAPCLVVRKSMQHLWSFRFLEMLLWNRPNFRCRAALGAANSLRITKPDSNVVFRRGSFLSSADYNCQLSVDFNYVAAGEHCLSRTLISTERAGGQHRLRGWVRLLLSHHDHNC